MNSNTDEGKWGSGNQAQRKGHRKSAFSYEEMV